MSRTYWRSLAQIEQRPEFRDALEREFPEGASELPDGITRREMIMLVGASLSLAGLAGCRRPVEEIVPYVAAPEDVVPGNPPLLRDDHAVPPERLRRDRREPRRATDQDRGKPLAPVDPRGLERARPGVGARPLRSGPLAIGHAERHAEILERFRDGLGAAVRGSCRGWRRRPCGPLRVLLFAYPGAPCLRAPCPLPSVAVGDLRRRQRREPARGSAARHGARRRSRAPARSSLGDSRPRRRPAPHRPGDDLSCARFRGRKACGRLRWRDEPALRR